MTLPKSKSKFHSRMHFASPLVTLVLIAAGMRATDRRITDRASSQFSHLNSNSTQDVKHCANSSDSLKFYSGFCEQIRLKTFLASSLLSNLFSCNAASALYRSAAVPLTAFRELITVTASSNAATA